MAINPQQAIEIIIHHIPKTKFEIVPIENALGKIAAEDLVALFALPKFDNSAMDGYAILHESQGLEVGIIETIFAGDDKPITLEKHQCVKIMTGAKIPHNCSAIVPFEEATLLKNNNVLLPNNIKPLQHIRYVGEDIQCNEPLINKGESINFAKITLLASQGITHIKVYKKPKVVVFASGEELKLHYEKIQPYQIYNSNTPTLIARCQELGCDVDFIGQAQDNVNSIAQSIKNALGADLIITTGGVSVGEADFTKEAFNTLGFQTLFDGILIKPGKPTVFGQINETFILNLPGNPLACSLIFELFGRVIIQKFKGDMAIYPNVIVGKMKDALKNKKGRITLIPGFFDGEYFSASSKRSPGMVNVLNHCNAMIALDENVEQLNMEAKVNILPINWQFFTNKAKDFLTHE